MLNIELKAVKEVWIFTTPTCAPCKQLKLQLSTVPGIASHLRYMDIETDKNAIEQARLFAVSKVPTVILMRNGYPYDTVMGNVCNIAKTIQSFLCEGE